MSEYLDRTGEKRLNNFGSEMIIIGYKNCENINVFFPEYNWIAKNVRYDHFKDGKPKCPYERRTFGIGYLGEGKYKVSENGESTRVYKTWKGVLMRCYYSKYHEKESTYKDCKASEIFHNFQNFGEWDEDNYYVIEGEKMCLDKDILYKGNKIYSPDTCIYVPQTINSLFTKRDKLRGDLPIGVYYHKRNKKFVAKCSIYDFENKKKKRIYLGCYNTPEEAFNIYKEFKEKHIKQVADYYKDKIPQKLYDAMHQYEVEITD